MRTRSVKSRNDASPPARRGHDDTAAVTAFLNALQHPFKPVIEEVRGTILSADKTITEGIKWNTASFYCHGWFATINVRARTGVQVVLHHGAKTLTDKASSATVDDSSRLLTWPAPDRAVVTFASAEDFRSKQKMFKKIIRQWAEHQARIAAAA